MRVDPNLYSLVGSAIDSTAQGLQVSVQQLSSGLRIGSPSDDPSAAAANLRSLAASAGEDRYSTNSDAVLSQNQMADSVLSNVVNSLTQAVTLGTEGANGSSTTQNRAAIAVQVQGLLDQVVSDANQKYNGVSLFAGSATNTTAFAADSSSPTGYAYQGNSNSNQVPIGDGLQVPTGIPGEQIFSSSGASVLGSLAQLVSALKTGTTSEIGSATAAVSSAIGYVGQQRTTLAGVASQIQEQESYLSRETVTLTAQQQQLTGVDTATAIEQMTQAQTAHSAVLAAAAKILPLSLLNYLNAAGQ